MDLAILLNIPFCVVPCCVFPSEFPQRKIRTSLEGIFAVKGASQEASSAKVGDLNDGREAFEVSVKGNIKECKDPHRARFTSVQAKVFCA